MRPNLSLWLLVVGALAPQAAVRGQGMGTIGPPQRVASFINIINYDWDDDNEEQDYLDDGRYTPNTNVITGIKIREGVADDPEDTEVFVAVPRWFGGVPSTLNRINVDLTDEAALPLMDPVLEPWPSWEMQEVGNCDALQYVQSMEIDNQNRMWVIDTGSVDIFTGNRVNDCPPKLVIFDVDTGEMVDEPFIFSEDVMPYDSGFLNDIVIDIALNVAYITDMTGDNGDDTRGALIVYDRTRGTARRFYDPSMAPEPGFEWVFEFEDLGPDVFSQAVEAIALTPDGTRVFYSPLQQAASTYSVSTSALRSSRLPGSIDWRDTIVDHGPRRSSTDGWTFDCAGNLFHSSLNEGAVYRWDHALDTSPEESGVLVWQDTNFDEDAESGLWWTDTYAWDDAGHLWVTANYLPEVFRNGQFQATNIFRVPTEAGSYQLGECDQPESYADPKMIGAPNTPHSSSEDESESESKTKSTKKSKTKSEDSESKSKTKRSSKKSKTRSKGSKSKSKGRGKSLAEKLEGYWKGVDGIVGDSSRSIVRNDDGTLKISMYNSYLTVCDGTNQGIGYMNDAMINGNKVIGVMEIFCFNSDNRVALDYVGEMKGNIYNDAFINLGDQPDHVFWLHKTSV